jgi:hypothetical protein
MAFSTALTRGFRTLVGSLGDFRYGTGTMTNGGRGHSPGWSNAADSFQVPCIENTPTELDSIARGNAACRVTLGFGIEM